MKIAQEMKMFSLYFESFPRQPGGLRTHFLVHRKPLLTVESLGQRQHIVESPHCIHATIAATKGCLILSHNHHFLLFT